MCVPCLRTSCLVPSDCRPGSRTGRTEEKGGREQEEEGTVEGFSLSDGRKRGGWEVVFEEGGRREYVRLGMEEAG